MEEIKKKKIQGLFKNIMIYEVLKQQHRTPLFPTLLFCLEFGRKMRSLVGAEPRAPRAGCDRITKRALAPFTGSSHL